MSDTKKPQIIIAPGAFDGFDGTQEELDALVAEIKRLFESGEAQANAVPLSDEEYDAWVEKLNSERKPRQ